MRKLLVVLTFAPLLGCSSTLDADANGIWLQESMIPVSDLDAKAEAHCQKYGKQAKYQSTLKGPGQTKYMMPIRAYKCV